VDDVTGAAPVAFGALVEAAEAAEVGGAVEVDGVGSGVSVSAAEASDGIRQTDAATATENPRVEHRVIVFVLTMTQASHFQATTNTRKRTVQD
jgi:hypothetical protein